MNPLILIFVHDNNNYDVHIKIRFVLYKREYYFVKGGVYLRVVFTVYSGLMAKLLIWI